MVTQRFDISYAAHTSSCTFLLDDEGICRRIVMVPKGKRRESSQTAIKCVGAQYVASLDGGAAGGLVEMPRVGAAMLFARTDERGRISLVRTGVLVSFESRGGEDPFLASQSVETSAPVIASPAAPAVAPPAERPPVRLDPIYYDATESTQRITALRADDFRALRDDLTGPPVAPTTAPIAELTTAEYDKSETEKETEPKAKAKVEPKRVPPVPVPLPLRPVPLSSRPPRGMLPRAEHKSGDASAAPALQIPRTPPAFASDILLTRATRARRG